MEAKDLAHAVELIPRYIEWIDHPELIDSELACHAGRQRNFVRVMLERQDVPGPHRRALAQFALRIHQSADIVQDEFQVAVAPEPLVNRLRGAIDRQDHEINTGFDVSVRLESLNAETGR